MIGQALTSIVEKLLTINQIQILILKYKSNQILSEIFLKEIIVTSIPIIGPSESNITINSILLGITLSIDSRNPLT